MISKKIKYVESWHAEQYIKDTYNKDVSDMSGKELMECLFGIPFEEKGRFLIVNARWVPETNWKHRINRIWVSALTIFCAPYQYIKYGEVGWSESTPLGDWLHKIKGCL